MLDHIPLICTVVVQAEGVVGVVSSSTEVTPHLYWGHVTDDIQVMWAGAIVLVLVDTRPRSSGH